jgi:hypothetical protein
LWPPPAGGLIFTPFHRGPCRDRTWDHQVDSPLAGPCDLRHAGVSLWLNAGVHAPEVADRAGHSVDGLLKVYAKCIDY